MYVPLREASKITGIPKFTLHSYAKKGILQTYRTPSNHFMFSKECLERLIHSDNIKEKQKIIYARVSTKKQEDDLERQVLYLKSLYPDYHIIKDVGSGINWKRKGLQTILEYAMSGTLEEVVVAHRDRLCRFAFELIEHVLQRNGARITVLHEEEHKSPDTELAEDLLSIVHIFSCKEMGRRKYHKNEENKNVPEQTNKTNI